MPTSFILSCTSPVHFHVRSHTSGMGESHTRLVTYAACHIRSSSHMQLVTYTARHICSSSHTQLVTYSARHIRSASHTQCVTYAVRHIRSSSDHISLSQSSLLNMLWFFNCMRTWDFVSKYFKNQFLNHILHPPWAGKPRISVKHVFKWLLVEALEKTLGMPSESESKESTGLQIQVPHSKPKLTIFTPPSVQFVYTGNVNYKIVLNSLHQVEVKMDEAELTFLRKFNPNLYHCKTGKYR